MKAVVYYYYYPPTSPLLAYPKPSIDMTVCSGDSPSKNTNKNEIKFLNYPPLLDSRVKLVSLSLKPKDPYMGDTTSFIRRYFISVCAWASQSYFLTILLIYKMCLQCMYVNKAVLYNRVADPEWFIPDPNFLFLDCESECGSGSGSDWWLHHQQRRQICAWKN